VRLRRRARPRCGCSDGARLPVINLHAEAGGAAEDIAARTAGIEQLVSFIVERFPDGPLVVAGDTNLHGFDPDDEPLIARILEGANLQDACRFLGCGDEQIDRVFFRRLLKKAALGLFQQPCQVFLGLVSDEAGSKPSRC
jgi:hypothetical protein